MPRTSQISALAQFKWFWWLPKIDIRENVTLRHVSKLFFSSGRRFI